MAGVRTARPLILVVEDDQSTRRYLDALLSLMGYEVACAESGEHALQRLSENECPGLVLLDLVLPGLSGLDVLDRVRRSHPSLPVIVLSTLAGLRTVVDAVKRGAFDYLTKPFRDEDLALAIETALARRVAPPDTRRGAARAAEQPELVSASARMLRIREIAHQVAEVDAPVLITGESGVGKEVLARLIHARSARHAGPLVKVNCAALPNELLESELFGYDRGAFSGAQTDKPGKFELAHHGSILLDEVGEMTPHLQAKLLHVLQDGEFSRLGGRHALRVDARVLATTNISLTEAVAEGRFREDLYFRLNVVRIEIPPLRERREDVPLLCKRFLQLYADRYKSAVRELPPEVLRAFLDYDWPGNVRELENAVRRYLILQDVEGVLSGLQPAGRGLAASADLPASLVPEPGSLRAVAARAADEAERALVLRVLEETRWNRKEASRRLHVSYKALLNKLKKWEAHAPAVPPARATRVARGTQ